MKTKSKKKKSAHQDISNHAIPTKSDFKTPGQTLSNSSLPLQPGMCPRHMLGGEWEFPYSTRRANQYSRHSPLPRLHFPRPLLSFPSSSPPSPSARVEVSGTSLWRRYQKRELGSRQTRMHTNYVAVTLLLRARSRTHTGQLSFRGLFHLAVVIFFVIHKGIQNDFQ